VGQLTSISNSNSATSFTAFDPLGRVTASSQQVNGLTYGFSYTYNLAGALTSETYPSGRVLTGSYDVANRAAALGGNLNGQTTNYITQTAYLGNGGINKLTRGNGVSYSEGYNSRLQLTSVVETNSQAQQLLNLGLNWGTATNNGTLQSVMASGGGLTFTQTFGYDGLNRLISASEGSTWSQSYNYDRYGNMWMPQTSNPLGAPPVGPGAPTSNAYSASNNRNTISTYDAAGNLTTFGAVNVSYDAENRQKAVGSNSYSYDAAGQRVGRTTASGATTYVYDAFGRLAAEYGSGTAISLCATCYLSTDHLGSTRLVTDQYASVVARHDYAPFGQEIPAGVGGRGSVWGASDNVNQKFTGKERDPETGLDWFSGQATNSSGTDPKT
jgi:YD repeat-containing protein